MAFGFGKKSRQARDSDIEAAAQDAAGQDAAAQEAAAQDAAAQEAAAQDAAVQDAAPDGVAPESSLAAHPSDKDFDKEFDEADTAGTSTASGEPGAAGTASAVDASGGTHADSGTASPDPSDVAYERSVHGPFDVDEIDSAEAYVDLGALLITPHDGLALRLEVEEESQRVIAVTLDLASSSLQLQAFAAPRSEGLWDEIREQIGLSVGSQGGTVEELDGTFGPEVLAKLPAEAADGSRGYRVARFLGVDGPRWFLRGVLGGDAALDRDAAAELEKLFRAVVVVRGESPLPPRELLALRLPKDSVTDSTGHVPADHPAEGQGAEPFRRGPEITEIG